MNEEIIAPRVDFLDPRTGKISREWYLFLLFMKKKIIDVPTTVDVLLASNVFSHQKVEFSFFQAEKESIIAGQVFGG